MRGRLLIVLFACLLSQSLCRPQQIDYNNENSNDNVEEDDNEPVADDNLADDEDAPLDEQEPAVQEEEAQFNRRSSENRYLQRDAAGDRPARTKTGNFPNYKPTYRDANSNDQFRSPLKTRQSEKYMEADDDASGQQESDQHLTNRDVNKANRDQNQPQDNPNIINKRTIEFNGSLNEEGDMLFQNNKEQRSNVNKNEYNNNEALDSSEQSRYIKQYYNTMQAENRGMADDKNHLSAHYNLRDRRDTKELIQGDALNSQDRKENVEKTSEDEETAIKRHIKKLSGDELEQLLNSLSEEKRELLKKIINDSDNADNSNFVNKREITKKAGAIEENNFVETAQSDLSKVQGSAGDINSGSTATQNTETTETSKQTPQSRTETNDISSSKTAETDNGCYNKVELTRSNDEVNQKKSDNTFISNADSKNQPEFSANIQVTSKTESKRETNLVDLESMDPSLDDTAFLNSDLNLKDGQEYSNDEGYFCPDENLSQFLDDDARYHNEQSKTYKREVDLENHPDLTDSMKSLEESFPNSAAYGASGPYLGPLIRVKRKDSDQIVKKRSAAFLPDAKVAYFPYKAENEDEDNDEGKEFDDEGFYDRTSNFANSNKAVEDDTSGNSEKLKQPQKADTDESKSSNDNPESDTVSLGSDTDSVLSGVEGVDDNLMFSSGSRNIRTADDNSRNDIKLSKFMNPTSLIGDSMKTPSENYINVPHYQENDAFGPLPRSHEGDLGRYKRIRRLKQSHNSDDQSSDMSV